MPSLAASRGANAAFCPSYIPVAIFVGGTGGVGQVMAEAFSRYTNGRAHIIIVGRNSSAAESIVASFPKPADTDQSWSHEFIHCDIQLVKNVYATTEEILKRFSKVNFLILSAGLTSMAGRENTEEGLDRKLVIRYYARWAFIDGFLPALRSAQEAGQDVKVMSVLAAGFSPKVDAEDLGLQRSFSGLKAMMQTMGYSDLMVAEYARREPNIAFTHICPGQMKVSAPQIEHWIAKFIFFLVRPLILLFGTPPEECAEYMLFALLDGEKGMYRRSRHGDDIGMTSFPGTLEDQKRLWDHSVEVVSRVRSS